MTVQAMITRWHSIALTVVNGRGADSDIVKFTDSGVHVMVTAHSMTTYPANFEIQGRILNHPCIFEFPSADPDKFKFQIQNVGPIGAQSVAHYFVHNTSSPEWNRLKYSPRPEPPAQEQIACIEVKIADVNGAASLYNPRTCPQKLPLVKKFSVEK